MRLTLHLMTTEFGLSFTWGSSADDKAARVFGIIFEDHIRQCGLQSVTRKTLRIQYYEHTYASRRHLWGTILHPPNTTQEATLRREVRQRIADAIQQVDGAIDSTQYYQPAAPTPVRTPTPTPPPAPRKRSQLIHNATSPPPPAPKKRGRTRKLAMVAIPTDEIVKYAGPQLPLPSTPSKTPYHRRYGPVLNLSDRALAKIPKDWIAPAVNDVHPPLPELMFRFWSEDQAYCFNSKDGFVAGKYVNSNVMLRQPPTIGQLDPADIFNHVEGLKVASPFISVSSSLIWCLKNAIKELKKGRKIMLSVISSAELDTRSVFYTRSMINSVRCFYPFTGRKFLYYGSSEFWVWHEIPQRAILSCFPLQKFLAMANNSPGISKIIQPNLLQRAADIKLREELMANRIEMDDLVAASCADLVQDFGLKATSNTEEIQCLVSELVSGWMMNVTHKDEATWADLSSVFAHAFAIRSLRPLRMKVTEALKLSFLLGVCRGLKNTAEKNISVQGSPANLQKLQRKAISVGLENPSTILRNEMDAAKIHLAIQQKGFERRFLPSAGQLLLQDEVDVETEGNEHGSDDLDVYEFDEGGMIL